MIFSNQKTKVILLILSCFISSNLFSQRGALKALFETESHVISQTSRNLTNESRSIIRGIKSSRVLVEEHQSILRKFWSKNKETITDIAENLGEEVISNSIEKSASESFYLYQIFHHRKFKVLYKSICKKLNVNAINSVDIVLLLIGQEVNNYTIKPEKLYRLHFLFSDEFAAVELGKIVETVDCSSNQAAEILKIAKSRNIKINKDLCINQESENDDGDAFWGICLLSIAAYITFRIYKRFFRKNNESTKI